MRRLTGSGELTVGIHEAKGSETKEVREGEEASDMTLSDVAIIHEFGAPSAGIPERSFIRAWADESKARHDEEMAKMAKLVIAGKMDLETALARLGLRRQAEVQKRIADGIPPPNSPKTIEAKGSSKPLVDTGQLRSAISHEIKVTK
ncbi:MAG TPA: hypothetical protein VM493_02545 [Vicinamibacterales bacterium]|nr:hypothetical protein [Vicinamibacterales bacterium]